MPGVIVEPIEVVQGLQNRNTIQPTARRQPRAPSPRRTNATRHVRAHLEHVQSSDEGGDEEHAQGIARRDRFRGSRPPHSSRTERSGREGMGEGGVQRRGRRAEEEEQGVGIGEKDPPGRPLGARAGADIMLSV